MAEIVLSSLAEGKQLARIRVGQEGSLKVDARKFPSGIYACTLIAGGKILKTVKLVIIR
jgi:hypothetical protein